MSDVYYIEAFNQYGNLSQKEWAKFVQDLVVSIYETIDTVHYTLTSNSADTENRVFWSVVVSNKDRLLQRIETVVVKYGTDVCIFKGTGTVVVSGSFQSRQRWS